MCKQVCSLCWGCREDAPPPPGLQSRGFTRPGLATPKGPFLSRDFSDHQEVRAWGLKFFPQRHLPQIAGTPSSPTGDAPSCSPVSPKRLSCT